MGQFYPEWGGYIPGMITLEGSFLINGVTTPDGIKDGNTNIIESVARDSAGLFTVTLADGFVIPESCVTEKAWLNPADATPVLVCSCGVVEGSYSQVTRSFQILTTKVADTGADAYFDPAPEDPDDNSRVCFQLRGSGSPIGVD